MTQYKKAIIYCRVSDAKQRIDGHGLESQEHRCRQHCADKQFSVEAVFHDDVSGGGDYSKRPGMTALLNFLSEHQNHNYIVVFDDLKRLARDTLFYWQLRTAIADYGASVECLNYTFDDTPEGEFIETLFAAQGQLERKQNRRQVVQKMKARMESGYYVFSAPTGYRYEKHRGHGKLLTPLEPAISAVREALEGFASGHFQTKEEVRHFLEACPDFPKYNGDRIGNDRVNDMLTAPIYAGYIEYAPWGITLRKGHHEPVISFETYQRIQKRLKSRAHAPAKKNIHKDFPLRGFVECTCGAPMTAGWTKGRSAYYPYYYCQTKGCEYKGKSIKRDVLETAFYDLLTQLTPAPELLTIADAMFNTLWKARKNHQDTRRVRMTKDLQAMDAQITTMLDRIVDAKSATVIQAFEKRIENLEDQKRILSEKINQCGKPIKGYEETYRTAMTFLSNPHELWASGQFENKRAVIKLAFTDRIIYDRKSGYRTAQLSLPFKAFGHFFKGGKDLVEGTPTYRKTVSTLAILVIN